MNKPPFIEFNGEKHELVSARYGNAKLPNATGGKHKWRFKINGTDNNIFFNKKIKFMGEELKVNWTTRDSRDEPVTYIDCIVN